MTDPCKMLMGYDPDRAALREIDWADAPKPPRRKAKSDDLDADLAPYRPSMGSAPRQWRARQP